MHHLDVEIEVSASCDVGQQSESKSISAALRNAAREGSLLILGRPRDLLLLKVAGEEFSVKRFKVNTVDDIQRVDNIPYIY